MSQASDNIAAPAASGKAATRSKSKPAAAQAPTRQAATQGQRTVVTFITAQRACPDAPLYLDLVDRASGRQSWRRTGARTHPWVESPSTSSVPRPSFIFQPEQSPGP